MILNTNIFAQKEGRDGCHGKKSILQAVADDPLCPVQCAADGAFVNTPLPGNFGNVFLLEIVGKDGLPLKFCQFLFDDPFDPLQLYLPGQPQTAVGFKECISCHGNSPFRNNVP